MIIGVPKEVKTDEYRVSVTPAGVAELVKAGHRVYVESCAGEGSGFSDSAYVDAGASLLLEAAEGLSWSRPDDLATTVAQALAEAPQAVQGPLRDLGVELLIGLQTFAQAHRQIMACPCHNAHALIPDRHAHRAVLRAHGRFHARMSPVRVDLAACHRNDRRSFCHHTPFTFDSAFI